MDEQTSIVLSTALIVFGCLAVLYIAVQSRRHVRDLEHRERLAMIERGLVPPPEVDPGAFEATFGSTKPPESVAVARSRTAGVMMIGLGFAFMFLVSFAAGEAAVGVGVGGAFALMGAAFFVNAMLLSKTESRQPMGPSSTRMRRAETQDSSKPPADG